ncbi:MAG: DMT family transporter [Arenicella sp.]
MLLRLLPFAFVLFWSTGFIAAKYGLPYAGPYTFLAARFILVLIMLAVIVVLFKSRLPNNKASYFHLFVVGMTVQVMYLGGVFSAIKLGLPAGITAVIVGMQPILTAFIIHRFSSLSVIITTIVGFLGLLLVVIDFGAWQSGLTRQLETNVDWLMYVPSLIALFGITFGTLYQKKFCADVPVIVNAFIQFIPTCVVFIILAFLFEAEPSIQIDWHPNFMLALLWSVIVLSIVSILLMNLLYQHNSASSAASYFYLTPPVALVMSYFLFDETISVLNFIGIALVVVSVYMSNKLKL